MHPEIAGADSFNWVIAPAGRCVSLVAEETHTAALVQRGLIALAHQGPLLESARRELARAQGSEGAIVALIAEQSALGKSAKELIDVDFHPINAHGIVGLWVAIEVAVEDTAVLILLKDPSATSLVQAAGVKVKASDSLSVDAAREIYHRLERQSRKDLRVAGAYCRLLSLLGVSVTLSAEVEEVLSELNYVRNCLLHRGGVADNKAKAEAPNLNVVSGEHIKIATPRYLRYFDAVKHFATALLSGAVASRHAHTRS